MKFSFIKRLAETDNSWFCEQVYITNVYEIIE